MEQQRFVEMALKAWSMQVSGTEKIIMSLADEDLLKEIAPGRNRGVYIIGHLVAVHDAMNDILGLGTRAHAELDPAFIANDDKAGLDTPTIAQLKQYWKDVHE